MDSSEHETINERVADRLAELARLCGRRYAGCRFETFAAATPDQAAVLAEMQDFASRVRARIEDGQNLLLFGSEGTGKDHLLYALMATAIPRSGLTPTSARWQASTAQRRQERNLVWADGCHLFEAARDRIDAREPEEDLTAGLGRAAVLAISDPVRPGASLTPAQEDFLFRVIDARYRNRLPTWCTMNARNRDELNESLGQAVAARLIDGAKVLYFNWPSYRKRGE
jgi:DNA replication protein DnaC